MRTKEKKLSNYERFSATKKYAISTNNIILTNINL